jgi:hypothetical protein
VLAESSRARAGLAIDKERVASNPYQHSRDANFRINKINIPCTASSLSS